jgi:hypothetical protein
MNTMKTLRTHLLGLELADAAGATLGHVVDTYPLDGGGELEMVRSCASAGSAIAACCPSPSSAWRAAACVRPFTRIQIEDSPGVSTGRHSDEDPWRAKAYWYYEEPVSAGPRR